MNKLILIYTFILLASCGQSMKDGTGDRLSDTIEDAEKGIRERAEKTLTPFTCADLDFHSTQEQADSLVAWMERATQSDSTNRQTWEQQFFCAFPSSFQGMQALFGYDKKGAPPLYDYTQGADVIQYFSQLHSIPDSIYYDRYIQINIDGQWEADHIREAFAFHRRLLEDTHNVCEALARFSDRDIQSVFHFIFDGPHPKNGHNEEIYQKLKLNIDKENKQISQVLTDTYAHLMTEDHRH